MLRGETMKNTPNKEKHYISVAYKIVKKYRRFAAAKERIKKYAFLVTTQKRKNYFKKNLIYSKKYVPRILHPIQPFLLHFILFQREYSMFQPQSMIYALPEYQQVLYFQK